MKYLISYKKIIQLMKCLQRMIQLLIINWVRIFQMVSNKKMEIKIFKNNKNYNHLVSKEINKFKLLKVMICI